MSNRSRPLPTPLLLLTVSLTGMAALVYATRWGIGVSPDSTHYIFAARNLLAGRGLGTVTAGGRWVPLVHWPPLFPLLLAAVGVLGIDPAHGARWLNVLIFGGNLLLAGGLVWRYTGRVAWGCAAAALMLVAPPLLLIHAEAWSEPAFLLFALAGLSLLAVNLERPNVWLLVGSAVLVSIAFLGRYAGVSLLPAAAMGILLFSRRSLYKRLIECVIFVSIACIPMAAWSVRNQQVGKGATDRSAVYHPITEDQLAEAAQTIRNWVIPENRPGTIPDTVSFTVSAILLLAFLVVPPLAWWRHGASAERLGRLPQLLWLFVLLYLATVLLSLSYFDAGIPLDDRILSPLYAAGMLVAVCIACRWSGKFEPLVITACIALAFFSINGYRSAGLLYKWHRNGLGMTRRVWVQSPTLAALERLHLPKNAAIYSNGADAIEFRLGRPAWALPGKSNEGTRELNSEYRQNLDDIADRLRLTHGVIVLLNLIPRPNLPTEDELTAAMPLRLVIRTKDGEIYRIDEAPTTSP